MKVKLGIFLALISALIITGCSDNASSEDVKSNEDQQNVTEKEDSETEDKEVSTEVEDVPEYEIVSQGDTNVGNAIRLEYWVKPDLSVTEDGIKAITKDIVEEAKDSNPFNAIVLFFIDDERQVDRGYSMAKAEYSPNGNWEEAVDVETGDYSNHEYVYDIGSLTSGMLPSDYEDGEYPTEEELDIYFRYSDLMNETDPTDLDAEKEVISKVADEFGLSDEEADDIIMKVVIR
ncbi:hypothetical protein SH601_14300 [Gracilibacillus sp. S3-1-1]|uniref:Uncharacterized protein n=1 Tax=Gracilibacillus pellucidus TaxID=3095368 RepID=A0ACC6M885_9BACI|nr:hypothetical protein [Gracilibacillus sp. S3-1-1]MDX8047159.1 hypothetical protein [Gracilibacillus sp. S3-1-1]